MKLYQLFEELGGGQRYRLNRLVGYFYDQYISRPEKLPIMSDVKYFYARKLPFNNLTPDEEQRASRILDYGKDISRDDLEHYPVSKHQVKP